MRPAAVAAAYTLSLALAVSFSTPRRVGDGGEYLVMAQRLAALQAPVVDSAELDQFKTSLRTLGSGFESALLDYPAMVGRDGRQAFLHFWLYPFLVVPGLWITQLFQLHPNWAFTLTNIAMLAIAVFVVARRAPLIGVVYLFLGPIVWWADKAHTEAFLFAALAIAVVSIESSPAVAMASWSLAGAQNASIGVVYPIFVGLTFAASRQRRRWTLREYLAAAAGAVITALPMLYNWIRVGKLSPMTEYAHLSAPSPAGLLAFLGEPNIGIIVNAPAYVLALVGLLVGVITFARSGGNWWPAVIQILLLFIWSQNPNANHGGTPGVNRWVLALLPLSLPWVTGMYVLCGRTLRSVLAGTVAVLAVCSAYWHLPYLPENYLNPTATARTLWSRGWLYLTPAEVFAERTAHTEGPALPLPDRTCGVALVWDLQSPIACIPPAAHFPSQCAGVDGFCFAVSRDDAVGVIHAPYNGFFFRADARSWPATGPLASSLRNVLLTLDSHTHRWAVADERHWIRERRDVDIRAVLERPGRVFIYIAHTGSSPSLVIRAASDTEVVLHRLIPLQTISTSTSVDGASTVGLPADATNLAVALRSPP